MKALLRVLLTCATSIAFPTLGLAQTSFQNLDFEAAHNIPIFNPQSHPWSMPASNAIPGWTCYLGTNRTGIAYYNDVTLDSAGVGLQATDSPYAPSGLLNGQYCASLQFGVTGIVAGPGGYLIYNPASIAQMGEIPADAMSIQFNANYLLSVTFDGTSIPLVILNSQPNYNVYGGDVGQFAGQFGELRFTSYAHFGYLDSIQFSSQSIPEPSTFSLVLIGLVILCRNFRCIKR